ncbi:MAG: metallophosphoesterase family protein [Gammaproteobacteria bacterium]
MKIAVLSDLHAAPTNKDNRVSWLCGDTPRRPAKGHPVTSLAEFIREHGLTADYVLVPGDISDKCNRPGFPIAWDAIHEVARHLNARRVTATTGNHDIDSRQLHGKHPFEVVKSMLGDSYPFEGPAQQSFWSHHFALLHEDPLVLLVINSAASHTNIEDAKRGAIDESTLERLESELQEFDKSNSNPNDLRVALCHHHPHQHSGIGLPDSELMKYGDHLLAILEAHSFGLVVHGHKHHPSLEFAAGGANSPAVFAAGSFSATMSSDLSTTSRNLFHILSINLFRGQLCGTINSWQFHFLRGWTPSHENAADFPARSGFGYRGSLEQLAARVCATLDTYPTGWDDLVSRIPEVQYLTPRDFVSVERALNVLGAEIYRNRDGLPMALAKV